MMMDRGHFEDSFSVSSFKVCYLDHNRKNLNKIDQSHQEKEQRHLKHIGCSGHKAAQSQRSCISHKNSGRVYIKKKEAHEAAYNCAGNRLNPAFCSDGHHSKENCNDQRHAGCKTVKTVCKVDAVYRTDHSDKQKRNCQHTKIQIVFRPERNFHGQRNICIVKDIKGKNTSNYHLKQKFLPCKKTVGTLQHNLQVVVKKSDDSKSQCQKQDRNDSRIILYIKQRRYNCRNQKYNASHGRSSCFFQMGLHALHPFCLAHFQFSEKRDNHRSQNQADCKRNQNRYYNLIIHPHTSYHSFVFIS